MQPERPLSAANAGSDLLVGSSGIHVTISIYSNDYGSYSHGEEFIPLQITTAPAGPRDKRDGVGENLRDWIHFEPNAAVHLILEKDRTGETYLIGADGDNSNGDLVALILQLTGRPADDVESVTDRTGHRSPYATRRLGAGRRLGSARPRRMHSIG